jgi:hypothetical protein
MRCCCVDGVAGAGPKGSPGGATTGASAAPPAPATQPPPRRGWQLAAGAASLGVWAFMPKCPLCLAAYVTLWTGLGLSLAAATYLRWSLLIASAAVLLYLVAREKLPARAGGFIRRFLDTNPTR